MKAEALCYALHMGKQQSSESVQGQGNCRAFFVPIRGPVHTVYATKRDFSKAPSVAVTEHAAAYIRPRSLLQLNKKEKDIRVDLDSLFYKDFCPTCIVWNFS